MICNLSAHLRKFVYELHEPLLWYILWTLRDNIDIECSDAQLDEHWS
jgi:hypothetical protein